MLKYLRPLVFGLLLVASCKKNEDNYPDNYTNDYTVPFHVEVYNSGKDFCTGAAPLYAMVLQPGETGKLYPKNFEHRLYYVHWYTEDYKFSVWPDSSWLGYVGETRMGGGAAAAQGANMELQRVALNGDNLQTVWKAVRKNNQPLPANEYYQLTLRRDRTYTLDQNGTVTNALFIASNTKIPQENSLYMTIDLKPPNSPNAFWTAYQGYDYLYATNEPGYGSDSLNMYDGHSKLLMVRQP